MWIWCPSFGTGQANVSECNSWKRLWGNNWRTAASSVSHPHTYELYDLDVVVWLGVPGSRKSMFPFHSPGIGEEMGKLQDDGCRKIPDRGVNATKSKAGFHNKINFDTVIPLQWYTIDAEVLACQAATSWESIIIRNVTPQLQLTCTSKTGKLGVIKVKFQRHWVGGRPTFCAQASMWKWNSRTNRVCISMHLILFVFKLLEILQMQFVVIQWGRGGWRHISSNARLPDWSGLRWWWGLVNVKHTQHQSFWSPCLVGAIWRFPKMGYAQIIHLMVVSIKNHIHFGVSTCMETPIAFSMRFPASP